jgi:hypothetical protein
MKKLLFLTLLFSAIMATTSYAQPAGDPASMLQQMKEKQAPPMVEKTGLTLAQAEKIIELNFEMRQALGTVLRDLKDEERSAKIAEYKAAKEKKFTEFLTADQIKAVNKYYEDMAKNAPQRKTN